MYKTIYIYIYIYNYIYIQTGALQRDMPVFVQALAADFKLAENKLDALEAQISRDFDAFDALSTDLETPEKMSWY